MKTLQLMFCCGLMLNIAGCGDNSTGPLTPVPTVDAAPTHDAANEAAPEAAVDAAHGVAVTADWCAKVTADHAEVVFVPPHPKGVGFLELAAGLVYPNWVNKPNQDYANPYCVAAFETDDQLTCDLGGGYPGTVITFNLGQGDGTKTTPITHWFVESNDAGQTTIFGQAAGCVGPKLLGSFYDGQAHDAFAVKDGQVVFTIPVQ